MLSIAFTILLHIIIKMWSYSTLRQQSTDLSSTYDTMLRNPHRSFPQVFPQANPWYSTRYHKIHTMYHIIHPNVAEIWGVGKYIWYMRTYHFIHWQILKSMLYLGGRQFFKILYGRGRVEHFIDLTPDLSIPLLYRIWKILDVSYVTSWCSCIKWYTDSELYPKSTTDSWK